ncbi:MAG: tetratricopeptide repeat protein, partial [Pseudomonadota bacterium]
MTGRARATARGSSTDRQPLPAHFEWFSSLSPRCLSIVIFLITALLAALIYSPVIHQQFVDWDDVRNLSAVWKPSWERAGKIAADVDRRFTGVAYYHPLFFLSLMADQLLALSDPQPAAWIAKSMNVVYHLINSYLVFLVLVTVGINRRAAFLGTLIFVAHPVQVGTVAWVTERKNVLCLLFYLSSFLVFLRYLARPRSVHLVLIPLLLLAALLTKPQAVTLPAVMIAWLVLVNRGSARPGPLAAVVGTVFLIACAFGLFVLKTEVSYPGQMPSWEYRPLISAGAIWFYAKQFLFPYELVIIYPKWNVTGHVWAFAGLFAGLAAAAALILRYRKRIDRLVLFGGSFAVINILPVSGLIPFGYMTHSFVADHFMYFPMVGITLMVARGLEHVIEKLGPRRVYGTLLFMILAVWISALTVRAHRQVLLWGDPVAFWEATLKANDKATGAYINYGRFCFNRGQYGKALSLFQRASALAPSFDVPYNNMGDVYRASGDLEKAEEMYTKAIEVNPEQVYPRLMIAGLLKQQN